MSISPRALAELLMSAGYQVTERRLTDWRTRRWIPDVCRAQRPVGTGRGAHYEWPDSEIVAHVVTLLGMLELRGRMETAAILAWFSGFDVPRDDTRNLWIALEALPWAKTLRSALAGEDGSARDAVDILVAGERQRQHRKKDGYSDGFVDLFWRMRVDPAFDARTDMPSERLAKILEGDVPNFLKHGAEFLQMLSPDVVRGLAVLLQDYLSAPRLIEVIQAIPDEMLSKAHADVRFVLSPYRAWMDASVRKAAAGCLTDAELSLLWMGPRLAWRAGRILMQLDVGLRRMGFENEVDATIAMIRDLAAKAETREVVKVLKESWQALVLSELPGDAEDASTTIAQELNGDPAFDKAVEIFQHLGSALKDLWLPRLRLTLSEAAMESVEGR